MRVLITRPREDAEETAHLLEERGIKVATESMLAIVPVAAPDVSLEDVQAILFTSANGVRALAAIQQERDIPVYTVGDASARAARLAGYDDVHSAGGDVETLAKLVAESLEPGDGKLLHPAASVVAGDLKGLLAESGFQVDKVRMYESRPAVALTDALIDALKNVSISAAFFFSPRTAKTFVSLAQKAGVQTYLSNVTAYALSKAVASELAELSWCAIRVAEKPEQDALLAVFDEDCENGILMTARETGAVSGETHTALQQDDTKCGGEPMSSGDTTNSKGPEDEKKVETTDVVQAEPVVDQDPERDLDIDSSPEEDAQAHSAEDKTEKSGGGFGLVFFLLLVIAGLAGFASLPYWKDKVPQPYQSYLPEFPQSQTATQLANLSAAVEANKAEVAQLQSELATVSKELAAAKAEAKENSIGGMVDSTVSALQEKVDGLALKLMELGSAPKAEPGKKSAPVTTISDAARHRIDLLAGAVEKQAKEMNAFMGDVMKESEALQDAFGKLDSRLETVELTRAEASSVLKLSDRINDVEKLARAMVSRHDASLANLLAVIQLRAKAADGLPFDAELRTARALAANKAEFDAQADKFADMAGKGVATTTSLRTAFDVLSATAAKAAAAPQGGSLVDKTVSRVMNLVTVRRMDGKDDGPSVNAMLARAETALNAGDIAAATAGLKAIEAPAVAATLKPWIERAEARVALDAALSTLTSDALARVAGSAMQNEVAEGRTEAKGE